MYAQRKALDPKTNDKIGKIFPTHITDKASFLMYKEPLETEKKKTDSPIEKQIGQRKKYSISLHVNSCFPHNIKKM